MKTRVTVDIENVVAVFHCEHVKLLNNSNDVSADSCSKVNNNFLNFVPRLPIHVLEALVRN